MHVYTQSILTLTLSLIQHLIGPAPAGSPQCWWPLFEMLKKAQLCIESPVQLQHSYRHMQVGYTFSWINQQKLSQKVQ